MFVDVTTIVKNAARGLISHLVITVRIVRAKGATWGDICE